jgi:hypothetical protein
MKWIIKNVSTITKISKRTKFNKFRLFFLKGKSQMHFVFFGLLPKKDESDIIVPVKRALMLLKSYIFRLMYNNCAKPCSYENINKTG